MTNVTIAVKKGETLTIEVEGVSVPIEATYEDVLEVALTNALRNIRNDRLAKERELYEKANVHHNLNLAAQGQQLGSNGYVLPNKPSPFNTIPY